MALKARKGMTEERRKRAAEALRLRRDAVSYAEIANRLGVSVATAHQDVHKALEEITREPAEEVLKLELERLDSMYLRLSAELGRVGRKLKADGDHLDLKAIDTVGRLIGRQLDVGERRAKLLGLDVQRTEVTFDSADAIVEQLGTILHTPVEDLVDMVEGDTPEEA